MPGHMVTVTVSNELSDGTMPNSEFKVKVKAPPVMKAGSTAVPPSDIPSKSAVANNGGIYESHASEGERPLEGIVGYTLPGGKEILAIYVSNAEAYIGIFPGNDNLTEEIMKRAREGHKDSEEGVFTVSNVPYNYTASLFPLSVIYNSELTRAVHRSNFRPR